MKIIQTKKIIMILAGFWGRLSFLIFLFLGSALLDLAGVQLIATLSAALTNKEYYFPGRHLIEQYFKPYNPIIILGISIGLLFSFKFSYAIFLNYRIVKIGECLLGSLRERLYKNLIESKYINFIEKDSSSHIQLISSIATRFCNGLVISILKLFSELFIAVALIVYLLIYNPVAIIILGSLFTFFIFLYDYFIRKPMINFGHIINKENDKLISLLNESTFGFKEIRIFNVSKNYLSSINKISHSLIKTNTISQVFINLPRFLLEYVLITSFIIYSTVSIHYGLVSNLITGLSILGYSAMRLLPAFNSISYGLSQYRMGQNDIDLLYEGLDSVNIDENTTYNYEKIAFESLELRNINFCYNDNRFNLTDINLKINKGEFLGIVGESGSGKSTLMNIISGLIHPNSGICYFNNREISLNSQEYRNCIALVSQKSFIPSGTLSNSITLGTVPDDNKLLNAIHTSKISKYVSDLEYGLESRLQDNGNKLSGGQSQRLSLARAFYHDRDLLILDEPTSSLDSETEAEILRELLLLKGRLTIIMVTHRKECLSICDRVYRLADSRLFQL